MKNWRGTGINYRSPPLGLAVIQIEPHCSNDKIRPVDMITVLLNVLIHGGK